MLPLYLFIQQAAIHSHLPIGVQFMYIEQNTGLQMNCTALSYNDLWLGRAEGLYATIKLSS
jgi:hypothetical protein